MITEYQNEIKRGDLLPDRASQILLDLSAIQGNVNDEIRLRDMDYGKKLLECYNSQETANRAKIIAETTPEYELKRIARDTKELVKDLISSLKYFLRAKEEEMKNGRFQS